MLHSRTPSVDTVPCAVSVGAQGLSLAISLFLGVSGCADQSSPGIGTLSEADSGVQVPVEDAGSVLGCIPGQTQSCVCGDGDSLGRQSCMDGEFAGACTDCAPVDTETGTLCVSGRYVGTYEMPNYYPVAAGFCGLASVFGGGSQGEWSFSLEDTGSSEFFEVIGTESCLEVTIPGKQQGQAADADAGTVSTEPFKLALTGNVDCATGKFSGEVKGVYYSVSVCNGGTTKDYFPVKGRLSATFDPKTRSFKDGAFELQEPEQALDFLQLTPPAGGEGTWHATLEANAIPPEPVDDCLEGKPFKDFPLKP